MLKTNKESFKALYRALLSLENEKECEEFLADICTIQELESLAQRLQVAQMLDEGKSYLEVNKETATAKVVAMPERSDIDFDINEQLIVEFYSK